MKRLYLLRHAEALSTGTDDKSRVLSEHGKRQAEALQATMMERGYKPHHILCSAAERTQETLRGVCPDQNAEIMDDLYNATDATLMRTVLSLDSDPSTLMIVAHNPGIHQLAFAMANEGEEANIQSLAMGYQPCTLAVLDCPIESWADLMPRGNTLVDLIPPQN
ncbi:MAG: histidine phosphatase family protein [Pseudomonadota bacterium]